VKLQRVIMPYYPVRPDSGNEDKWIKRFPVVEAVVEEMKGNWGGDHVNQGQTLALFAAAKLPDYENQLSNARSSVRDRGNETWPPQRSCSTPMNKKRGSDGRDGIWKKQMPMSGRMEQTLSTDEAMPPSRSPPLSRVGHRKEYNGKNALL